VKRESKYIAILSGFLVLFVVVQLFGPKPLDWTPTYLATDKNPFGAFIARSLMGPFFNGSKLVTNNLTFYELQDSIQPGENIISLSDRFDPDDEAAKTLFSKVDSGSLAFISAYYFSGKFADSLKLFTADVYFSGLAAPGGETNDTTDLKLVLPNSEKKGYYYRIENVSFYFSALDSLKAKAFAVSTNAWGKPVRYKNLPTLHSRLSRSMVRKRRDDPDVRGQLPQVVVDFTQPPSVGRFVGIVRTPSQLSRGCLALMKNAGKFRVDDACDPVHNKDLPSGKLLGLFQYCDGVFHVTHSMQ